MRFTARMITLVAVLSLFGLPAAKSYAWWHERGYVSVGVGYPGPYYYGYPAYYAPPYPVVVSAPDFQPMVVNGVTYYLNNGVYYIYTQFGYESVPAPAANPSGSAEADTITINVPKDKGGTVAVVLKRSGNGYVGPQGEFYAQVPSMDQLKLMYGK